MFGRSFLKGVFWGGLATGLGLVYVLVRDDQNREMFVEKGVQIKNTVSDLFGELVKEGKSEWREMEKEVQKTLPLLRDELMDRLDGLEKRVKQLGEMVSQ